MNALDRALATEVMGYEFLELDYWDDAGPRQNELKDWLDTIEDAWEQQDRDISVGDYYINVEKNIFLPVEDFTPSKSMLHAWQVVEHVRSKGVHINLRSAEVLRRDTVLWTCEITNKIWHTRADHNRAEVAICQAIIRFYRDWGIS